MNIDALSLFSFVHARTRARYRGIYARKNRVLMRHTNRDTTVNNIPRETGGEGERGTTERYESVLRHAQNGAIIDGRGEEQIGGGRN